MNRSEANHFVDEPLETSAIAFGVRDHRSPHLLFALGNREQSRTTSSLRLAANTLMLRPRPMQASWRKFYSSCISVMSWGSNQKRWTESAISFVYSSRILRKISTKVSACDTVSPTCQLWSQVVV